MNDEDAMPINIEELEGFDKKAVEMSVMFWDGEAPDGDPMPHVIIEDHFGKIHIMAIDPDFMSSSENKDRLAMMVKVQMSRVFAAKVAFMCGAWTVNQKVPEGQTIEEAKEAALDGPMPSQHPDRIEISFVQILEPGGVDKLYSSVVERVEDVSPILTGWTQSNGESGGRFHDEWSPTLDTCKIMYETGVATFGDDEEAEKQMLYHAGQVMDRLTGAKS